MNDLFSIAQKTMEKYEVGEEVAGEYEKLPDGEYNCLLEEVTHRSNEEKKNDCITFKFSVLDEDYANKYLFVNYYFGGNMKEWQEERNFQDIRNIVAGFGYDLPADSYANFEVFTETLNQMAGNQAIVKQTTNKNDYTTYKVTPNM